MKISESRGSSRAGSDRVARVRAHAEYGSAGAWAAPHLERRLLLVDLRDDGWP